MEVAAILTVGTPQPFLLYIFQVVLLWNQLVSWCIAYIQIMLIST